MNIRGIMLKYLGWCPSKESAQDFRVRNNPLTLKQKEYRDAIIGGIGGGIGSTILWYIKFGEVPWVNLVIYPIVKATTILTSIGVCKISH